MSGYRAFTGTRTKRESEVSQQHPPTNGKVYVPNYFTEAHSSYIPSDLGQPPCFTSSTSSTDSLNQNKQGVPNLNYFGLYGSEFYANEHTEDGAVEQIMSFNSHSKANGNDTVQSYPTPSFWGEGELDNLEQRLNTEHVYTSELFHKVPHHRQYDYSEQAKNSQPVRVTVSQDVGYKSKRIRLNESKSQDAPSQKDSSLPSTVSQKSRICFFVHHAISPHIGATPQHRLPRNICKTIKAHTGAVNSIEWCLPQYSHLLLSTSMDKTVKIWNVFSSVDFGVQTLSHHTKAVKDAEWSASAREVLSCGFDCTARLSDVEKGTEIQCFNHPSFVTCLKYHPINHHVFMTGAHNAIYSWDSRLKGSPVSVYTYKEPFGQVQDLVFLNNGRELISCTDLVSRDSADRSVMAWDVRSKVVLSNQIYQERYTCTRLKCHPVESRFIAQTNGDYLAVFSTERPYTMSKEKRFEGHKVQGYNIGFDISTDGSKVLTGSADGNVVFYDYKTSRVLDKISTGLDACVDVLFHPILNSTVASCGWNGNIVVLQ